MQTTDRDYLSIDDRQLTVDHTDSSVQIESLGAKLGIRISAKWTDLKMVTALRSAGLLPDYAEPSDLIDDHITIRFSASKVFERGLVPGGEFGIEQSKHLASHTYLYVDGIDYGLDFYGKLTLQAEQSGVAVDGTLRRTYEKGQEFKLAARLHYDATALKLGDYNFTSLEEVRQIPPEKVRTISLSDFKEATLPKWLAGYTEVRTFYMGYRDYMSTGRLTTLPDWLQRWGKLESFTLHNYPLEGLPGFLGDFPHLTRLSCGTCTLTEVPLDIWKHPKLESLFLDHNKLRNIPIEVDLPALQSLDLNDNQLRELPAGLITRSPKLRSLRIERNDFQRLASEVLATVPDVRLEVEVRQRLAPKPPVAGGPYNNDDYRIDADPARKAKLDKTLKEADVKGKAVAFFHATTTPAIGFTQAAEPTDYDRLGNNRFGGLPDLPAGSIYPRFGKENKAYEFIAQLDCTALAPLQDYLPRTGFLFCFLSTFHDLYAGNDLGYPVALLQYHDVPRSELRSGGPTFSELTSEDYFEAFSSEPVREGWGTPCYRGFDAEAGASIGLPPTYSISSNLSLFQDTLSSLKLLDEEGEIIEAQDFDEDLRVPEETFSHMAGGYGFSQHELPAVQAAHVLGGDPKDYVLLLDVHSQGDMQWGDAGELHLVIHKGALAKRDFSQVFAGMYSS